MADMRGLENVRRILVLVALVAGCLGPTEPDFGGQPTHTIELDAAVEMTFASVRTADSIVVRATFTNVGSETSEVAFGLCAFITQFVGAWIAWDNRAPAGASCPDVQVVISIPPGETRSYVVFARVLTDLRRVLPAGRYDISVFTRVGGRLLGHPAGKAQL